MCLTGVFCVSTGVLQLSASGDLPADDWSAVAGRGPGQPGSLHAAAARPLRLLSVSVPRADGGACRALAPSTMTTGQFTLLSLHHTIHCHDNKTMHAAMTTRHCRLL